MFCGVEMEFLRYHQPPPYSTHHCRCVVQGVDMAPGHMVGVGEGEWWWLVCRGVLGKVGGCVVVVGLLIM